jgi:hypothetical protein
MIMMRLLRRTLMYLIASLVDIQLTVEGTKTHPEGNPFSEAWMILCGPFLGLVYFKGLVIIGVVIWIYFIRKAVDKDYSWLLNFGTFATLLLCSIWFTK